MANKIETKKNISYSKVIEYIIIGIAILYLIIHLVSPVFNSTYLFWGINFTRFLPSWSSLVIIAGIIYLSIYLYRNPAKKFKTINKKQLRLRYFILGVLALTAIIAANIDAFVLGDGENIFMDVIRSIQNIAVTVREPLSFNLVKFFYHVADFITPRSGNDLQSFVSDTVTFSMRERSNVEFGFTIQGVVLFILFYLIAIQICKIFFEDNKLRFWSVPFIICSGFITLFSGYVEYYILPITLNLAFHYSVIRTIRYKEKPYLPIAILVLGILSHFGMIIYVPTLLLTLWFSYQESKLKIIPVGIVFCFLLFTSLYLLGYSPLRIFESDIVIQSGESRHFIPFFNITNRREVYTAFSPFHFLDILNWFLLINPFAMIILVIFFRKVITTKELHSPILIILLTSSIVSFGLIFIFNCDISMIIDWDLLTPYCIPIILTALWFLSQTSSTSVAKRILQFSVIALILHSSLWLWTLASDDASIKRVKSLQNTKTFSPEALFVSTSHLVRYYGEKGNIEEIIKLRKRLIEELSPTDSRNYFSLARQYDRIKKESEAMNVLKLAIDNKISDYRIDGLYAEHLYKRDQFRDAIKYFQKYLGSIPEAEMDSVKISAIYTKLGWCYFNVKSFEDFRVCLQKSIIFNHSNTEALLLLGRYFVDEKNYKDALPILQSVLTATRDDKVISNAKELIEICRSK